MIRDAALALVVFNESQAILDKDLELFETLLAEKQVLAGFRRVQTTPVLDRIGHRLCSVASGRRFSADAAITCYNKTRSRT